MRAKQNGELDISPLNKKHFSYQLQINVKKNFLKPYGNEFVPMTYPSYSNYLMYLDSKNKKQM